jgi:CHAD domain-containing protein
VADSQSLWKVRSRALLRAREHFRSGEPDGLHDLRVALRRIAATARALGRRKLERRAKKLAGTLSADRQLEVDRALLLRIRHMGLLSEGFATALGARWESQAASGASEDPAITKEKRMRRLAREVRALAANPRPTPVGRLLAEREEVEASLAVLPEHADDETLHRYRLLIKRARYLAEDLVGCGRIDFEPLAARERAAQDVLGRWNDLRYFVKRIRCERGLAQSRGAVRLASELDDLARALEAPLARLRRDAVETAGQISSSFSVKARSA